MSRFKYLSQKRFAKNGKGFADNSALNGIPKVAIAFIGQSTTHGNVGAVTLTGGISNNVLTVTANSGAVEIGSLILPGGGTVISYGTGTGSTGTYNLSGSVDVAPGTALTGNIPQVQRSLSVPAVVTPMTGAYSPFGGALPALVDLMAAKGVGLRVINTARGSMSLFVDGIGTTWPWAANKVWYARRAPNGSRADRGFVGDRIVIGTGASTRVHVCTVGNFKAVANDGQFALPGQTGGASGGNNPVLDSVYTNGTLAAAGTQPAALASAAVGDVTVDGGISWTCEFVGSPTQYGGFVSAQLTELVSAGFGFDPHGVFAEAAYLLNQQVGYDKYVYIDGNQSDLGASQTNRSNTVQSAATYFLRRGIKVIIGDTMWSPGSSGTVTSTQTQKAGNQQAFDALKTGPYAAMVFRGADLLTTFGTTSGEVLPKLQSDQIHPTGRASVDVQAPAYATAISAVIGA